MPGWQQFVVDPLAHLLTSMAGAMGGYGIAIIVFTVVIRLALLPLTLKQLRSQRRMQDLQPKIAALKKQAKGDRQKESQLTMELYKQEGVNPMAGCFPVLIQMPVLLGLYGALLTVTNCVGTDNSIIDLGIARTVEACRQAGGQMLMDEQFLWFNLAGVDRTFSLPIEGIPFLSYISVLALLAGAVQFLQSFMVAPVNVEGAQATMARMMQFFPIMIVVFAWTFFSGIVLYWVLSGVVGVVQQFFTTGLGKMEGWFPEGVNRAAKRLGAGKLGAPSMHAAGLELATARTEVTMSVDGGSGNGTDARQTRTRRRKRRRRRG